MEIILCTVENYFLSANTLSGLWHLVFLYFYLHAYFEGYTENHNICKYHDFKLSLVNFQH